MAAPKQALRAEVRAVLDFALTQVGVRETGTNRGREVEAYLASVDNPPGAPWCAAFIHYCIERAVPKPTPWVRTAYCPTIAAWADDLEILCPEPVAGDAFLLYSAGRARHTGFVVEVTGTSFRTCEGNTNTGGSAEGVGVFRRTRNIGPSLRYVRWPLLLPNPRPQPGHFALYLEAKKLAEIPVIRGRAFCPVRLWGNAMGYRVRWDNETQTVQYDRETLDSPVTVIDGVGHAPVRRLAAFSNRRLEVDPERHTVTVL